MPKRADQQHEYKTDEASSCTFCTEFNDVEDSDFRRLFPSNEIKSRILEDDGEFVLLAALGGFSPGYILLLPQEHVSCVGALGASSIKRLEGRLKGTRARFERIFGKCVVFEHGSCNPRNRAGGCIDHAHIHLMHTLAPLEDHLKRQYRFAAITSLMDLATLSQASKSYIYLEDTQPLVLQPDHGQLPSQFIRREVARLEGNPESWDWASNVGLTELRETIAAWAGDSASR